MDIGQHCSHIYSLIAKKDFKGKRINVDLALQASVTIVRALFIYLFLQLQFSNELLFYFILYKNEIILVYLV